MLYALIPPSYWHHALHMATYLHNILPSKVLSFYSPTEILYWKEPTYSHLRVFGCLYYVHLPSTSIHKLQSRSVPCVFLGFPSNHRGYKCLDLSTNKIIISHHVTFDESSFPFAKIHTPSTSTYEYFDDGMSPYLKYYLQNAHV